MGDVFPADLLEKYGSGLGSRLLKGSFDPFEGCSEYLNQGDLNIINLESVLANVSSRGYPWSEIMRGSLSFIDLLKKHRIHAVNLANNHSMDHGEKAFDKMVNCLDEAGIFHFGGPRDFFSEDAIDLIIKGYKVSILGYYIEETLPVYERDLLIKRIVSTVRRIKNDQLLILSLHWGSEYTNRPFSWMINACKELADEGVEILYGHHGHTYQGVATYKNRLIAPGMGNFIFEDIFKKNRRTALLQAEYDGSDIKFRTIPMFIDKSGKPAFSKKASKYVDLLNNRLKEVISHTYDSSEWDRNSWHQVKAGHIKNRLKIRAGILMNPVKYYPFIFSKNEH